MSTVAVCSAEAWIHRDKPGWRKGFLQCRTVWGAVSRQLAARQTQAQAVRSAKKKSGELSSGMDNSPDRNAGNRRSTALAEEEEKAKAAF